MRETIRPRILALLACLLVAPTAHSAVVITAVETGGDVVFSMAAGQSIDTSGLSYVGTIGEIARVKADIGLVTLGPENIFDGVVFTGDQYTGVTAPDNFGPGGNFYATDSSGVIIGVDRNGSLVLPRNYVSNSLLGASSISFEGQTFASMGITAGNYVYDLGGVDTLTLQVVPIPAAVWLFGSALAGLGWIRRRQTA